LQGKFITEPITYTGQELRSHWIYEKTGILDDAIIAFRGPARVEAEDLVDLKDKREGAFIYSEDMLHFLVEHFELDLEKAILRQRLLVSILKDELRGTESLIEQRGDDLFDGQRKLSVAIATLSGVSSLIHVGINISSQGTPVKTKGLADYGIDPEAFAQVIVVRYCQEIERIRLARCQVRGVR